MTRFDGPDTQKEAMSTTETDPRRFDVIEVADTDPNNVRLIAEDKSEADAEAIIGMAVLRRGVKHSYFTTRPHASGEAQHDPE